MNALTNTFWAIPTDTIQCRGAGLTLPMIMYHGMACFLTGRSQCSWEMHVCLSICLVNVKCHVHGAGVPVGSPRIARLASTCERPHLLHYPGLVFCMRPANERRRYTVTSSLVGWAHTQKDPWDNVSKIRTDAVRIILNYVSRWQSIVMRTIADTFHRRGHKLLPGLEELKISKTFCLCSKRYFENVFKSKFFCKYCF